MKTHLPLSESEGGRFTAEEISVLKNTSTINGLVYPPWYATDASDFRTLGSHIVTKSLFIRMR